MVKWLVLVMFAMLVACGSSGSGGIDSALVYGPHDQVTTCDPGWAPSGPAPTLCEHACMIEPTPFPCEADDLCYDQPGCKGASTPSGGPMDCAITFVVDSVHGVDAGVGAVRGCCLLRSAGVGAIPTFYECSATGPQTHPR